ncbi:hypothetical protein [Lentzea sp. NPDC060358]|uniref:hypothetical protein n=1 Tax=Lentzea sp. NPDC060358 TaxID=3347103 RepID=UPI0036509000
MHHLRRALDNLPPEGLEFKLHILRRLLDSAPEPLTVSQIREGGPNRTDASAWYAMKALERSGAVASVPTTAQCRVARYRLADSAEEVVREFVADRSRQELPPPLSPLPGSPQHQQVLTVLCARPDSWFTVNELTSKLIRLRKSARRPTLELYDAGYLLRRMSDGGRPGRAEYQYRLNPDAATHAHALLDARVRSTRWH